jgi:hypothetical protein
VTVSIVPHTIESLTLYAGVGVLLVDDHTGGPPGGSIRVALDVSDGAGGFTTTDLRAVVTASGALIYPWLERRQNAGGLPPRDYRLRIDADLYVPLYRASADGIVVSVFSFDDDHPPQVVTPNPSKAVLLPAATYPFEPETPVVRGFVVDGAGAGVADALVAGGNERVLSDGRGEFALPLRWSAPATPIAVDATTRDGRSGTTTIQLPGASSATQRITVN